MLPERWRIWVAVVKPGVLAEGVRDAVCLSDPSLCRALYLLGICWDVASENLCVLQSFTGTERGSWCLKPRGKSYLPGAALKHSGLNSFATDFLKSTSGEGGELSGFHAARAPRLQLHQPNRAGSPPSVGDFPVPSLVAGLFLPPSGRHMETCRIKLQICSL